LTDEAHLNVRRLVMDVDKALSRPSLVEIADAIQGCHGVKACNITVNEIDVETIGMNITVEGEQLDYDAIVASIERAGAVVHSLDELVAGDYLLEHIPLVRCAFAVGWRAPGREWISSRAWSMASSPR
jgi:uncharacterized protein